MNRALNIYSASTGIYEGAAKVEAIWKGQSIWSLKIKRHCVTHKREQRGVYFYMQLKISKSDGKISSNCGRNVLLPL